MTIGLDAARAACDERDFPKAIYLLESHLEIACDDGRGWELLGITLQAASDFPRSIWALERASLLVPLFPALAWPSRWDMERSVALNCPEICRSN